MPAHRRALVALRVGLNQQQIKGEGIFERHARQLGWGGPGDRRVAAVQGSPELYVGRPLGGHANKTLHEPPNDLRSICAGLPACRLDRKRRMRRGSLSQAVALWRLR